MEIVDKVKAGWNTLCALVDEHNGAAERVGIPCFEDYTEAFGRRR